MKYPRFEIKVDEANRVVVGFACGKAIKAIARCNPEDTFDAAFGTRLVVAKLKRTCAKFKLQELKRLKNNFLKQLDQEIESTVKAVDKQVAQIQFIKEEKYFPKDKTI